MCSGILKIVLIVTVLYVGVATGLHQPCNCVPMEKCQSYLDFVKSLQKPFTPQILQYLKEQHCSFNHISMVCCSDTIYKIPSSKGKKKNCGKSDCIILRDCEPYLNLVKSMEKPLQPTVVEFLRSQECGFYQGYPMVCCSGFNIQDMKNKKSNSRRPLNKLSADFPQTITSTTTKKPLNKKPSISDQDLYKADALNKAFMSDYFDYAGSFDLMLRIKRQNGNDLLDIEIR